MEPQLSFITQIAQNAPGVAGMIFLAYLAYSRSNKSEEHVQRITDSFLAHIAKKDEQAIIQQQEFTRTLNNIK